MIYKKLENGLEVTIDPNGVWDHSEFPHPLVTCDFNDNGELIKVIFAGAKEDS